jgi:hypothetical protein
MSNNLKKKNYICASIKSKTPHEQCPAHRPVPTIDDDVKELASVAPLS